METENSGNLRWTVDVIQDGEELVIVIPDEMMEKVGWKIGDVLEWVKNDNESWTLKKND